MDAENLSGAENLSDAEFHSDAENLPGYESAYSSAAFFIQSSAGYLRVSGPDQSAFLQRQTTNDMGLLQAGRALLNVLTSSTARILDVFYLLQSIDEDGEGVIDAITLAGRGAETAGFLKSRIFFMDKVAVRDMSAEIVQIDLIGPQAGILLQQVGAAQLPTRDAFIETEIQSAPVRVLLPDRSFGLGYRLLISSHDSDEVLQALIGAGAVRLEAESYLILRVEAGQPEADYELTADYTPLETGLEAAVADGKGCYTGQEIIARQITYDKVTQHLCGIFMEKACQAGERVWAEGKAVGKLTSSVNSPRFGSIGLAILKRTHNAPGTALRIGAQSEGGTPAVVASLPFDERTL